MRFNDGRTRPSISAKKIIAGHGRFLCNQEMGMSTYLPSQAHGAADCELHGRRPPICKAIGVYTMDMKRTA